jgi:hypothetical protein
VIQIVVHQFVHKTTTEKNLKKIGPPLSPGPREYVESVLRRKKMIPYTPNERKKHVESILGTRENMTKKVFNLNNVIPHSVRLVNPYYILLMIYFLHRFVEGGPPYHPPLVPHLQPLSPPLPPSFS